MQQHLFRVKEKMDGDSAARPLRDDASRDCVAEAHRKNGTAKIDVWGRTRSVFFLVVFTGFRLPGLIIVSDFTLCCLLALTEWFQFSYSIVWGGEGLRVHMCVRGCNCAW